LDGRASGSHRGTPDIFCELAPPLSRQLSIEAPQSVELHQFKELFQPSFLVTSQPLRFGEHSFDHFPCLVPIAANTCLHEFFAGAGARTVCRDDVRDNGRKLIDNLHDEPLSMSTIRALTAELARGSCGTLGPAERCARFSIVARICGPSCGSKPRLGALRVRPLSNSRRRAARTRQAPDAVRHDAQAKLLRSRFWSAFGGSHRRTGRWYHQGQPKEIPPLNRPPKRSPAIHGLRFIPCGSSPAVHGLTSGLL
jgi:hypothetical protein